jgi:NADH pyrophosphatase NudC (nudix superfamily)
MRYCPICGCNLINKEADGRLRRACKQCDYVHWNNPTPVVAAIAEQGDFILLARKKGWPPNKWGLIAGFPEAGETLEEANLREVGEETGLDGEVIDLIGVYSLPWKNQVFIVYRVIVQPGPLSVGEELECIHKFYPNQIDYILSELGRHDGAGRALIDYLGKHNLLEKEKE